MSGAGSPVFQLSLFSSMTDSLNERVEVGFLEFINAMFGEHNAPIPRVTECWRFEVQTAPFRHGPPNMQPESFNVSVKGPFVIA